LPQKKMMLPDRIKSFEFLGDHLRKFAWSNEDPNQQLLRKAAENANTRNPWFTHEQIKYALNNLGQALTGQNINNWLKDYSSGITGVSRIKTIGVVMAGNIPSVGFHDFLCVLLCGYKLVAKLSSSDDQLIPAFAEILKSVDPDWNNKIEFTTGKLENFDAIIATGNSNTSKYFEYYFGRYPHIIRKNRNSIAIITGDETDSELTSLADDILLYFGMGCRSVSKILVPDGYNFDRLFKAFNKYEGYINHHKYRNNYDYNKSVMMVGQVPFIDTGLLLLKEAESLASPVSVLHFEYFHSQHDAEADLKNLGETIQCVICKNPLTISAFLPGQSQSPALWDYADQCDTMEFLLSLQG